VNRRNCGSIPHGGGPIPRDSVRILRGALPALALVTLLSGCDDQVKRVSWFSTMTETPAVQPYEARPLPPPKGSLPVGAVRHYTLAEADSLLTSPLRPTKADVARGRIVYGQFCLPCHGDSGKGDGPVVGPNRFPPNFPTMNLTSERAKAFSDGYIWGMIENGRGLMPSYRRVPRPERWALVAYVRHLQTAAE